MGLTLVGTWLNTLLGPEGSAGPRLRVGVVLVASGPPFVRDHWVPRSCRLVGCGWWSRVLVGLLFEICIVDASIL